MNFDWAIKYILEEEGGLVNNPSDPGGITKYGISQRQYPYLDIKNLTEENAKEIYRLDYWEPISGDDLPKPVGLCVLDCAVNQGVLPAIRMLQMAIKAEPDGVIGPQTRTLLRQMPAKDTVVRFMSERALRYAKTSNFDVFGKGWIRRLFRIHNEAAKLT